MWDQRYPSTRQYFMGWEQPGYSFHDSQAAGSSTITTLCDYANRQWAGQATWLTGGLCCGAALPSSKFALMVSCFNASDMSWSENRLPSKMF